jgi:cysteine desulfurase
MGRIYFDNAATTPLDPAVLEAMMPFLTEKFGNPSSIYSYGRESRMAIEQSRKTVARLLHAHPSEIFFTSGGTESSNAAIRAAVQDLGCRHIISSPLEHHATLHTADYYKDRGEACLHFLNVLPDGHLDLERLDSLLESLDGKTLVSLMHANNETGNLLDIEKAAEICRKHEAIFHSDTVQTMGHYDLDLRKLPVHFITGASHKFHGPKGVGVLFIRESIKVKPNIHGGSQERNMRAGTENVYGIVGFSKALEIACERMEKDSIYINELRNYMAGELRKNIPGVCFNGDSFGKTLYTILSVSFPKTEKSEMLLFNLDIHHICASGGSACTSGAQQGSHVIRAIYPDSERTTVRFSFSRHNTRMEVDEVVSRLKTLV